MFDTVSYCIILAAGRGTRMRPLTNNMPKCLLPYKDTTPLERLIWQVKEQGIKKIIVVAGYRSEQIIKKIGEDNDICIILNPHYETDTNILSMYLAIQKVVHSGLGDVVIFEGDMVAEDEFIKYIIGTDFENRSVWFTKRESIKNGGILKTDGSGNVIDIKVVEKIEKKYANWEKITGVMRISKEQLPIFYRILKKEKKTNQYYLMPWSKNINKLPSIVGNSGCYKHQTFNTIGDYEKLAVINFDEPSISKEIYLERVNNLYPVEEYDERRLELVKSSIINGDTWVTPLKVEKNCGLVLDGTHSLALAKRMKLKHVPVIGFRYSEVDMWSLREELHVTKEDVIKNAKQGNIYPVKSIKHKFPNITYRCLYKLSGLR